MTKALASAVFSALGRTGKGQFQDRNTRVCGLLVDMGVYGNRRRKPCPRITFPQFAQRVRLLSQLFNFLVSPPNKLLPTRSIPT